MKTIWLGLFFMVAFTAAALHAAAEPLAYRFEATIGPLPPGNQDVGLPFTLQAGAVMQGIFTIDPQLALLPPQSINTAVGDQPFDLRLSFDGFEFGADAFQSRAFNDTSIVDGPSAGIADSINLRCGTGAGVVGCCSTPLVIGDSGPLLFSLNMQFFGDPALLSMPQIPTEQEVWNAFEIQRSMAISFSTQSGAGAIYTATISPLTLVPEPYSASILGAIAVLFGVPGRRLVAPGFASITRAPLRACPAVPWGRKASWE